MELSFAPGDPLATPADALIVPVAASDDGPERDGPVAALDASLDGELLRLASEARFRGKAGATLLVPTLGRLPVRRLVLAGTGSRGEIDRERLRRAWGAAALAARDAGAVDVVSVVPAAGDRLSPGDALAAAAEGARLALYRFAKYQNRTADDASREVASLRFVGDESTEPEAAAALARATAIANAVAFARDLGNEPASVLTPIAMADHAQRVAAEAGLEIEVLGPTDLDAMGAGAFAAVGRGSANEPRLIRLRYRPSSGDASTGAGGEADGSRVVGLVGKCITFDTGGYSIKTYEGMLDMKGDMSGGAAVLGAMSTLRALNCPVAVDGTICAAENMISGTAFRPGDVLTALNGVTIEVLSTDAEGRLVLADGLVDAARRGATELIDLATLTGAAVVALGDGTTALFASDDALAGRLLAAAGESGERTWRMPLIEELNEKIKGDVADIKNTGGRSGGAITAALFLHRFSEGLPWAHLDIAGSARVAKSGPSGPKGATGVGVRTLLTYLTERPA